MVSLLCQYLTRPFPSKGDWEKRKEEKRKEEKKANLLKPYEEEEEDWKSKFKHKGFVGIFLYLH